MTVDLLAYFPPGAEPRPAQARLLEALGAAIKAYGFSMVRITAV